MARYRTSVLEQRSHRMVVAVDEWTIWSFYVHLAGEKGNTFLNNLLLKVFFADNCH